MSFIKEHILVFLAYISDVEPEVIAAKEVFENINRSHEQMGIVLDLSTWKDIPGEFGNPQQQINRELVEKCDVFIGVIHKKWGTPTGQSDCGFREEFDIAEKRYNETGRPTILLYAKNVNETEVSELERLDFAKVREFKKSIVDKHKGFLTSFDSIEKWREIIQIRLTQYLVSKAIPTSKETAEAQRSQAISTVRQYEVVGRPKTPKEVQELIDDLATFKNNIGKINDLEDFKKVRLFLMSSALLYNAHIYEILGNHEIHLIYLYRSRIKPTGIEATLIFRTIIADTISHKTGWYWLEKFSLEQLRTVAGKNLVTDPEKIVRSGSLDFLDRYWVKQSRHHVLNAINDSDDGIKINALQILAARGDGSCLAAIEKYLLDPNKDIVKKAWTAKFAILSRSDVDAAVKYLQEPTENRGSFNPYLEQIKDKISHIKLVELINDDSDSIKKIAYEQLFKRGYLSVNELRNLLSVKSISIRTFAHIALIDQGEKFDVKAVTDGWPSEVGLLALSGYYSTEMLNMVIKKIFEQLSEGELLYEIDWFSTNSETAYYIIGMKYYASFKEQLYKDLESDFESIKTKSYAQRRIEIKDAFKKKMIQEGAAANSSTSEEKQDKMLDASIEEKLATTDKLDKFIRQRFTLSALKVLVSKAVPESINYARKYAASDNKNIQEMVVKIMAIFGSAVDVPALIKIVIDTSGPTRYEAVRLALVYSGFDKSIIKQFLKSEDKEIIRACLASGLVENVKTMIGDSKDLLIHKTDEIRIYALSYLANILKRKELTALLGDYISRTTYYYNVVCWFDRILFAPAKIRSSYNKELISLVRGNN